MACSEGTPAVILVAMEVGAAIPMVITTRAKGGLASDPIRPYGEDRDCPLSIQCCEIWRGLASRLGHWPIMKQTAHHTLAVEGRQPVEPKLSASHKRHFHGPIRKGFISLAIRVRRRSRMNLLPPNGGMPS
jgi:hypothetical protein